MERSVVFGTYRFDRSSGQLWSGSREVRLTPKAAAVLGELVSRAGELVTKEELLARVWKDTIVGDDALISCVQELRRALTDNARQPSFIETRHRRGYCFIAGVSAATAAASGHARPADRPVDDGGRPVSPNAARRAEVEARVSSMRGRPTVAVLPFMNASDDTDQEYFTEGISADIITALARHRSLLVIARSSTFAFKGRDVDARRAGLDLGAAYVVDGSVAKSGQRLRIRARLIETDDGRQVWAERYDRRLEDIFEVQDDITAAIAARIEPEVGTVERLRAENKSPEAFRAWDFFHLGMKHFYKSSVEDNQQAQRLLRRAIDLDPAFAQAYAWLSYAIVLSMVYFDADPDEEHLNSAVMIAKNGVDLDDQDAVTHFAYGRALLARKSYEGALAELESATELNPTLAIAYCGLGDSLAYEGRTAEAIPYFEKAIALSPFDPHRWAFYSYGALAHLLGGHFGDALDWARKATRVPNCHYWPFAHCVSALGHLHGMDAAGAAVAELLERKPDFSCAFARRRLFFIKNPAHLELYLEGLRRAGIAA